MPLGSDSVENERQDFLTYENPLYNYSIGYPSYWRLDEEGGPQSVIIRVPDEQILDRPQLQIRNEEFPTNSIPKLEQYTSQLAHQKGANSSSSTLLSGYPAYEIVWNNSSNFRKGVVTIVNNTAYLLNYTSNMLDYDIYLDTIETMISSFRINYISIPSL